MASNGLHVVELVRLLLRTRRAIPIVFLASLAVAVGAAAYLRSSPVRYSSEAVVVWQPISVFDVQAPGGGDVTRMSDERRGEPEFLPRPLTAMDLSILLKTDAVLAETAAFYNREFAPSTEMTLAELKSEYTMDVLTHLEMKTPYEVKYHATLELVATAATPEESIRVARAWAESASAWMQKRSDETRKTLFERVDELYRQTASGAHGSGGEGRAEPVASDLSLSVLGQALEKARLAMINPIAELSIASIPQTSSPIGVRTRVIPTAVAAGLASFVLLCMAAVAVVALRDAIAGIQANERDGQAR